MAEYNISQITSPTGDVYHLSTSTWYGTCTTAAQTAEKAVTCDGFTPTEGAIICVHFTQANTAALPKLNINNTVGRDIYVGTYIINSTDNVLKWSANTLVYFMYSDLGGTDCFEFLTAVAPASVAPPRGANTWYGTSTSAATADKVATIDNYVLTKGSLVSILFSYGNTAAAPTLNINSTGAKNIYYKGNRTSSSNLFTWDANDVVTFMYSGSSYHAVSKSSAGERATTVEIVRWDAR